VTFLMATSSPARPESRNSPNSACEISVTIWLSPLLPLGPHL
jgi:hypothetical protein